MELQVKKRLRILVGSMGGLLVFYIAAVMYFLNRTLTVLGPLGLIVAATSGSVWWVPNPVAFDYLKHIAYFNPNAPSPSGSATLLEATLNGYDLPNATTAERRRTFEVADFLIGRGADVNGRSEVTGLTPLHAAILSCSPDIVQYVISKGADVHLKITRGKLAGRTPLGFAQYLLERNPEKRKDFEMVKKLLGG